MMVLAALVVFALLQSLHGVPTPPPPPPPPVARDPAVKAAIEQAILCVDADDGRNAADRATTNLTEAIGSPSWEKARQTVADYLRRRDQARLCINSLTRLKRSTMSKDDRDVVLMWEKGLAKFWLKQGVYTAAITGRLLKVAVGTDLSPNVFLP